ncbi:histidine phosphatase family protein [Paenibacillus sp. LMG 31456]|uniref:Histidine phosphatase family protein n=1 Tax=Paenibacillus foliorum TaxID=2654974 RepID=A0A972H0X7_9BACL|nr:histidine phosphatase family protein [Paenibacillus foliorum]NOU97803.1 histidine phosphatase family protein [Paenibacillus foliorum]
MELFIIRHGQSIGNTVPHDVPDGELTELGISQAARVAECLAERKFDQLICSPLIRAIETAQPLARALKLPIQIWKNTFEVRSKGVYRGPTATELNRLYPETQFRDDVEADGWYCSGDEDSQKGHARASDIWQELLEQFMGQRVALFAHGGFNHHLLLAILGLPHDSPIYFEQSNGSIYWVGVNEERTTVRFIGPTEGILSAWEG